MTGTAGCSACHDQRVMTTPPSSAPSGRLDAALVEGLDLPALVVDAGGVMTYANRALEDLLAQASPGAPRVGEVLGGDPGAVREAVRHVLAGVTWTGDLDLGLTPDPGGTSSATWTPVRDGDRITGALVLLDRQPVTGRPAEMMSARLSKLAQITADLLYVETVQQVSELITHHITDTAGATIGSLSLLVDGDMLALVGIRGGREGVASRWATYPLSGNTPAAEATRTGHTLLLVGREEIERRYPGMESAAVGDRTLLCLPLIASGRPLGVMTLSFPGQRRMDPAEGRFLRLLADTCAAAIDRLSAQQRAKDREAKLRFLAEAGVRLSSDLDHETTLRLVADLAVPWFADWCAIALEEDGRLHTLSVSHAHPEHAALVERLQRDYPPSPDAERGSYQVLRTGETDLIPEVTDAVLAASAQDETHLDLLRQLNFRSALAVPLRGRDRILGVITWVTGEEGRRFGEDDQAFGEDLARRAAAAIDTADLHSQLRDSALRLQRAVLPERLPEAPGWATAFCYLPAGRSGAGGDFYDVLPLDDGRSAFFVGDVMGRGVEATSVMAQMRSAVRTLIAVDPDPTVVMRSLDRVFERWNLEQLVTVVYGVADGRTGRVQLVNAGHPEPVVVRPDGVEVVATPDTLILGAGGGQRGVVTVLLAPGDLLLAFTDGLVERRDEDPDRGVARVATRAPRLLGSADLASDLARLVDEVRDPTRDDDVAALVLQRDG